MTWEIPIAYQSRDQTISEALECQVDRRFKGDEHRIFIGLLLTADHRLKTMGQLEAHIKGLDPDAGRHCSTGSASPLGYRPPAKWSKPNGSARYSATTHRDRRRNRPETTRARRCRLATPLTARRHPSTRRGSLAPFPRTVGSAPSTATRRLLRTWNLGRPGRPFK